jgi:hypothetical protein
MKSEWLPFGASQLVYVGMWGWVKTYYFHISGNKHQLTSYDLG